mmetsp:Transcript_95339/g.221284  ORF Transcript_95339/g.221284 Transcript_95339/m.221284 type:complete len:328 (-) Transcript_95339:131-1114(-)
MRSICSSVSRPSLLLTEIRSNFPVPLSSAVTSKIPFESTSKVTSSCGTPAGAGGMPVTLKVARRWFSLAMGCSPSKTRTSNVVWLSSNVEKVQDFLVGMTVLRCIRRIMVPLAPSMPSVSGVTSRSNMSQSTPSLSLRTLAWTAAPWTTASSGLMPRCDSGLMPRCGSLPEKKSFTSCCTLGIRAEPPVSTISSTWWGCTSESSSTCCTCFKVLWKTSSLSASNSARDKSVEKEVPLCRSSMSMRERRDELSSSFALWASRRSFCRARGFAARLLPCPLLKASARCSTTRLSRSAPPRCGSPLVATTSKTPLSMVSKDTSKEPPPKS